MPIGLMTDTRTKEWTAQEAVRHLKKTNCRAIVNRIYLCNGANGGGKQVVALLFYGRNERLGLSVEAAKVVKYRANSGRWTQPVWVRAADLVAPNVKEKRYRDALASLLVASVAEEE